MHKLIELTLADDSELDIPAASILMFEEMSKDTNPNFPKARSYITYVMGENDLRHAICTSKFQDIIFELGITTDASWLRLTKKTDGLGIVLPAKNVVRRASLEEGCQISYAVGGKVQDLEVKETRRQIKKWSEREVGRPEGLIEMPIPQEISVD